MTLSAQCIMAVEQATPLGAPGHAVREIAAETGVYNGSSVSKALAELVRVGRVTFAGETPKRRYWRVRT